MLAILGLLVLGVTPLLAASLYGEQGGYSGYASYNPHKNHIQSSLQNQEDSIRASAGSPDVSKTLVKDNSQEDYASPNSYESLSYKPLSQHGYGSNSLGQDVEAAPYAKATLYGEKSGGYKLSDAYQNQHIQLNAEKHQDYKDDYVHPPQPYEFGYALKDLHGNTQHRQESSDGHGKVEGSYGFTDEHGLYRTVQYVADKGGFRAEIKTNEPGTESQHPADVHVDSEQAKH